MAAYVAVLLLVFVLQRRDALGLGWARAGEAHAGAIVGGEWWRAITALTLHGDALHLTGNLVFGAILGGVASRYLGAGLAWLGILVAATLGNAINALLQAPVHSSIGASTAVFAALGIIAFHLWSQRRGPAFRRVDRWAPVVMGVFLLGFFGMSGERTDFAAHCTGFASGGLLGALSGALGARLAPGGRGQLALGAVALGLPVLAWAVAIAASR